jgi:L-2-hydroxyglutarate oxidase LhgO
MGVQSPHPVHHMSFVRGVDNRNFLKKRFAALSSHPLYYGTEYSEDKSRSKNGFRWLCPPMLPR